MTSNTIPITGGPHADMLVGPDSAQSARNLGLLIADNTLRQEDPNEFAEILAGYIADFEPYRAFETQCVRNMALATVRQNRLYRIETSVLDDTDPGTSRLHASSIMAGQFRENNRLHDRAARASHGRAQLLSRLPCSRMVPPPAPNRRRETLSVVE